MSPRTSRIDAYWSFIQAKSRCCARTAKKTDPTDAPSRRLTMIVAQEPAQPLAAAHGSLALLARRSRKHQDVALLLMVPSRQIFVPRQQLLVHRPRHVGQDTRPWSILLGSPKAV